jgi:hypothetical protein
VLFRSLHRTFAMGPYGLGIRLDDLWAGAEPLVLGGQPLAALDRENRLLHACYHAVLGDWPPRPVPLRDVAQLALDPRLDPGVVRGRAATWKGEPVVARALRAAWSGLRIERVTPLADWARRYEETGRDRRALAAYAGDGAYAAKSLAAVRAVHGWRNRAAFVAALAFPRRQYLDGRHRGHLSRWRRAVAQVGRARP